MARQPRVLSLIIEFVFIQVSNGPFVEEDMTPCVKDEIKQPFFVCNTNIAGLD